MQQMMSDPAVMQKAQAMASAMYGSGAMKPGAGAGAMGGGAAAEMARLRAENAALKSQVGI